MMQGNPIPLATGIDSTTQCKETDEFAAAVRAALDHSEPSEAGSDLRFKAQTDDAWIRVALNRGQPSQGWKIHVSADLLSAQKVLQAALPVLVRERVNFKVAKSSGVLSQLNEGDRGPTQVGKFITVYPLDDAQAVRLAVALDECMHGLTGPPIPTDRPLRVGSIIYYRYGAFKETVRQTPIGTIEPVILGPDGGVVVDRRSLTFQMPAWLEDPFRSQGAADPQSDPTLLVRDRYLKIAPLHHSPRGQVYIGADIEGLRVCVIKQVSNFVRDMYRGLPAAERLHNEARLLECLHGDGHFPMLYDLVEEDGVTYLISEHIDGPSLYTYLGERRGSGRMLTPDELRIFGVNLARVVSLLHAKAIVHRDLKALNVIVRSLDHLYLVDFDIASHLESHPYAAPPGRGTRGYMSPQARSGRAPSLSDDVYGFGAVMYFAATGADPARAPDPSRLSARAIRRLNPDTPPAIERLILRCLDPDPASRFQTMDAVIDELARSETAEHVLFPTGLDPSTCAPQRAFSERYLSLCSQLGNTLCATARASPFGPGLSWASTHPTGWGFLSRDINVGAAGTTLALAELCRVIRDERFEDVLSEAAEGLLHQPQVGGSLLPGLYVGEAGIGAALLRAGQVLRSEQFISQAIERGRQIAQCPYSSPDLFNGTAGRLRFHLFLYDHTKDSEHLAAARSCGIVLAESGVASAGGGLRWEIPPGYSSLSGRRYLGYAHGAAGIADSLLDLFDVTLDERFLNVIVRVARWLDGHAAVSLEDSSGLHWPAAEGDDSPFAAFWCHGSAGIGRFLLRLASRGVYPRAWRLAVGALRSTSFAARWAGPTQCHGLAGNIEVLLDALGATGETSYLDQAWSLGQLLETFGQTRDELLMWPGDEPGIMSPDYMVGYAGVAVALLRLGMPDLPHQISREAFNLR